MINLEKKILTLHQQHEAFWFYYHMVKYYLRFYFVLEVARVGYMFTEKVFFLEHIGEGSWHPPFEWNLHLS